MTDQPIQYAESSDGTRVAYRRFGSGRPVVFVGAALSTAEAAGPLAAAFAEAGLQGASPTIVAVGAKAATPRRTHPNGRPRICALSSTRSAVPQLSSDTPRVRCSRSSRRPKAYR